MKKYFLLITIVLSTIFSYGQVDVQTAGKIIVGVHAIGKRIGYGIRVHRNEKKIKKMEKSRDPKASCYYIDENGYLQIQSGPCYLPDGSYFKNILCTDCIEHQEKYRKKQESEHINNSVVSTHPIEKPLDMETQNLEAEKREKERLAAERLERERIETEHRAAEEKRIAIDKITNTVPCDYKFDVVDLSDVQKSELDEVATIMNKYTDISVLLTGHTCTIGNQNINHKKGLQRANIAKDYLMQKGIAEERIQTDSKGELEPIADNHTIDGRAKNRRIEISIVK